jgi:long-chain fatty acid transport protein
LQRITPRRRTGRRNIGLPIVTSTHPILFHRREYTMQPLSRFAFPPRRALLGALGCAGTFVAAPAFAGGLSLYEVGTEDVGLASAGYTARAQDASTVFTNPAGMTRLEGSQATLGGQVLYGDVKFTVGEGTSAALGSDGGGYPIGWFPGGGAFFSYSLSPDVKLGFASAGNFGLVLQYDENWVGRYYVQEATLLGVSFLPSIAWRVNPALSLGASVNAMYGKLRNQVAINTIDGPDGRLVLDTHKWGWGANLGVLYEPSKTTRFGLTWNSEVKLDFSAPTEWSGLSRRLETVLANRGLLNTTLDLGVTVPQGVNGSFFHQLDDRWALLGSVGWQQWSKFGYVEVGVNSDDPHSLTKNLDYKDTWHGALGAQYQMDRDWRLNFGVAYDSDFQGEFVSPLVPANSQWRFGVGGQKQESRTFSWGWSAEYAYGGTLDVRNIGSAPVALGGRGDLIGSYKDAGVLFFAANFNWKF